MILTTFDKLKTGDIFYKYDTVKSVPFQKIQPIFIDGSMFMNHIDDNTGELFYADPQRFVYIEE